MADSGRFRSRTEVLIPAPGKCLRTLSNRMGRDYPVEQMLDTLCRNGFAQAIALSRGAVEKGIKGVSHLILTSRRVDPRNNRGI
jgi:hypothetical protein